MKRTVLLSLGLVLCAAAVVVVLRSFDHESRQDGVVKQEGIQWVSQQRVRASSAVEGAGPGRFLGEQQAHVSELRGRWRVLAAEVGIYDPREETKREVKLLAADTVRSLSLNRELFDLVDSFKNDELLHNYLFVILEEVHGMLKESERAGEFRRQLLNLYEDKGFDFILFAASAGAGCSEDEIATFLDEIEASGNTHSLDWGRSLRTQALVGYAEELAKRDAVKAVSLVTEEFSKRIVSAGDVDFSIGSLVGRLPKDMDFLGYQKRVLEPAIIASNKRLSVYYSASHRCNPLEAVQKSFAARWAEVSLDEAAAYYLEHRETTSPEVFRAFAVKALIRDEEQGMKWINDLPEGPQRDHALAGMRVFRASAPNMEGGLETCPLDSEPNQMQGMGGE